MGISNQCFTLTHGLKHSSTNMYACGRCPIFQYSLSTANKPHLNVFVLNLGSNTIECSTLMSDFPFFFISFFFVHLVWSKLTVFCSFISVLYSRPKLNERKLILNVTALISGLLTSQQLHWLVIKMLNYGKSFLFGGKIGAS